MANSYQHTVANPVTFSGKGLHIGKFARVILNPAPVNTGIVFQHVDKSGVRTNIPAHWQYTTPMPFCTCLMASNGMYIRTVEHLLAACFACGLDNALIEVHGNEIPLLDGSAFSMIKAIEDVGLQAQTQLKKRIRVLKTVRVEGNNRYLQIDPAQDFSLDLGVQLAKYGDFHWQGVLTPDSFKAEIAQARTYGDVTHGLLAKTFTAFFTKHPIALGANLNNCIVMFGKHVLNRGGLRMPDEFIRHRILDLMGDLMLAQAPLIGKITGFNPAHRLNQRLVETILTDESAWCWDGDK